MGRLLRLLAVFVLLVAQAWPADLAALKPQGYVSDFAGVVDARTKTELERYCARVEQATGAQMAVVALPTLDGDPVEDAANALYRAWGIGKKGKDEGILLLLVIKDRRSRLEVGYGLEPILPDGLAGEVLRSMRPALRTASYADALALGAHTIGTRIAQAKGVTLNETALPQRRALHREASPIGKLIAFGVLALIVLFFLGSVGGGGGGLLAGMLLGNLLGRGGGGGGGGGGFGGYDNSGGGFGGFGGGDSGGGGASSDW